MWVRFLNCIRVDKRRAHSWHQPSCMNCYLTWSSVLRCLTQTLPARCVLSRFVRQEAVWRTRFHLLMRLIVHADEKLEDPFEFANYLQFLVLNRIIDAVMQTFLIRGNEVRFFHMYSTFRGTGSQTPDPGAFYSRRVLLEQCGPLVNLVQMMTWGIVQIFEL